MKKLAKKSTPLKKKSNSSKHTTKDSDKLLLENVVKILEDKKGKNITVLDVSKLTVLSDYFVLVSVDSQIQLHATAKYLESELALLSIKPISREGSVSWMIVDYGNFVVHLMTAEVRDFYKLESFWANAKAIKV